MNPELTILVSLPIRDIREEWVDVGDGLETGLRGGVSLWCCC